jgi:hypothetical protein
MARFRRSGLTEPERATQRRLVVLKRVPVTPPEHLGERVGDHRANLRREGGCSDRCSECPRRGDSPRPISPPREGDAQRRGISQGGNAPRDRPARRARAYGVIRKEWRKHERDRGIPIRTSTPERDTADDVHGHEDAERQDDCKNDCRHCDTSRSSVSPGAGSVRPGVSESPAVSMMTPSLTSATPRGFGGSIASPRSLRHVPRAS